MLSLLNEINKLKPVIRLIGACNQVKLLKNFVVNFKLKVMIIRLCIYSHKHALVDKCAFEDKQISITVLTIFRKASIT